MTSLQASLALLSMQACPCKADPALLLPAPTVRRKGSGASCYQGQPGTLNAACKQKCAKLSQILTHSCQGLGPSSRCADLGSGQLQGLLEVVGAGCHQVLQSALKAAQVHVHGVVLEVGGGVGRQALQLQQILSRVALAVGHHHVGQLHVVHPQSSPAAPAGAGCTPSRYSWDTCGREQLLLGTG